MWCKAEKMATDDNGKGGCGGGGDISKFRKGADKLRQEPDDKREGSVYLVM